MFIVRPGVFGVVVGMVAWKLLLPARVVVPL
jgi:hypothetical protein